MAGRIRFYLDEHVSRAVARGLRQRGVDVHPHAGIVYARQQTRVGDIIHGLMLIHDVLDADDMWNHVEFL